MKPTLTTNTARPGGEIVGLEGSFGVKKLVPRGARHNIRNDMDQVAVDFPGLMCRAALVRIGKSPNQFLHCQKLSNHVHHTTRNRIVGYLEQSAERFMSSLNQVTASASPTYKNRLEFRSESLFTN